jgi:PAS domain S-box-containing protein
MLRGHRVSNEHRQRGTPRPQEKKKLHVRGERVFKKIQPAVREASGEGPGAVLHELQEARDRYAELYDNAPVGYFTLNKANLITLVNSTGCAMIGLAREKLVGQRFSRFIPADNLPRFYLLRRQAAESRAKTTSELEMARARGERFWVSLQSIQSADGGLWIVVADISVRKQAEEALLKARAELEASFKELQQEADKRLRAEREMRDLAHRLVSVQEEERSFIARELHDEAGQLLTYLQMLLGQDGKVLSGGKALEESRNILDQAITRVRDLTSELRPALLDTLGLVPALKLLFKQFSEHTGVEVSFDSPETPRLSSDAALAAFRIVQEALTNVARHAHARKARVHLAVEDGRLSVEIGDEGRGFDPGRAEQSLGLLGMQERAVAVGGKLSVESAKGSGTKVTAQLPLD